MSDMAEPPQASGGAIEPGRNSAPARPRKRPLEAALIIAVLSAYGYLLAWLHEIAAAAVFGVPAELVQVSMRTVTSVGLSAAVLALLGFLLTSLVYDSTQRACHPVRRRVIVEVPAGVAGVLLGTTYPTSWTTWLAISLLFIFFVLLDWLVPLLLTNTRGYMEKLRHHDKNVMDYTPTSTLVRRVYQRWPYYQMVLFLAAVIMLATVSRGVWQARRQEHFFVPSIAPDTVVLRIYGNRLICAPVDRTTKQITRDFLFLRLGDDPEMVLRSERIGPLRPKE